MPVEVILPKVDMDMATGRISRWFVTEGAQVRKGDTLFEIETDKAAMEIDAPASGVIRDISGRESVDIPVGAPVAWIYEDGEAAARVAQMPEPARSGGATVEGQGDKPAVIELPAAPVPDRLLAGDGASVRAAPLARRLARAAGLSLAGIAGSGPQGRIVRADVEAHLAAPSRTPAAEAISAPEPSASARAELPSSGEAVLNLFPPDSYELVPHDPMRRTIARRLTEAKATIPHFYLSADCRVDALLALRNELNAAAPRRAESGAPAYKLSVNDLVIKALALALCDHPDANVSWTESNLVRHRHVDVGVAVSIPGGLITPIIRKAEEKSLSVISNEMKDLSGRARLRKLAPDQYQGGTTAVSNLGMFGIKGFSAIVNPPQATILAVGAATPAALVDKGEVKVATSMSVTLSADHRAVDGALAAELLAAFRQRIEKPMALLV